MGKEAQFQALPEDCDLMLVARQDREIAELIQFFNGYATQNIRHESDNSKQVKFHELVESVMKQRPQLKDRYFYAGARTYDAIVYLLSPANRTGEFQNNMPLIHQAIYGQERLHPEATATQGSPIGLVRTDTVKVIADYLAQITVETLHEHYDDVQMFKAGVYKMWPGSGEERFRVIWAEFEAMRQFYQVTAAHDEAVITVID